MAARDQKNYPADGYGPSRKPNTYRPIPSDSINKRKAKLISPLRKLKTAIGIDKNTYKKIYPSGTISSKFYGTPKVHRKDYPP